MEESDKQIPNRIRDEKGRMVFPPGVSGNPNGRPKGKTMKEYAREYLMSLEDGSKKEWLEGLSKETIWKMAEGNPHQDTDINAQVKVINVTVPEAVSKAFNINATNTETESSNTEQV